MEEHWGSRSTNHTVKAAAPTAWVPKKSRACPSQTHLSTFPWFMGNQLSRLHPNLRAPSTFLMSPPHLSWPPHLLVFQATPLTFVPFLCYCPCQSSSPPSVMSSLLRPFLSFPGPATGGCLQPYRENPYLLLLVPGSGCMGIGGHCGGVGWGGTVWEAGGGSPLWDTRDSSFPPEKAARPTWPKFTAACWAEAVKITTVRYSDNFSLLLMDLGKPKMEPQTMSSSLGGTHGLASAPPLHPHFQRSAQARHLEKGGSSYPEGGTWVVGTLGDRVSPASCFSPP